jgi:hypothetical protein
VTVNPLVTCGNAEACRSGRDNLCPDRQIISMPPREGAFAELSCHAGGQSGRGAGQHLPLPRPAWPNRLPAAGMPCGWAKRALDVRPGRGTGAGDRRRRHRPRGGSGLKAQGSQRRHLVEPNADARNFSRIGLRDRGPDPDQAETSGQYDLIVDGVGYAATRATATKLAKPGGVISHIGLGSL